MPSPLSIGGGKPRPVFASRAPDADAADYTRRRDNAHKIEELEVLYLWHPWFGRVVHVHEVIEQRAGGVLRCSPDGDASRRWLELPQWMFDRAACLAIRMAASRRVDTAALITLKTCLADASGTGLCGGALSNACASGSDLCIRFHRLGRTRLVNRVVITSDRPVAAWGALRANWIYLKVGARWGLGFRKGLERHYPDVR